METYALTHKFEVRRVDGSVEGAHAPSTIAWTGTDRQTCIDEMWRLQREADAKTGRDYYPWTFEAYQLPPTSCCNDMGCAACQ